MPSDSPGLTGDEPHDSAAIPPLPHSHFYRLPGEEWSHAGQEPEGEIGEEQNK